MGAEIEKEGLLAVQQEFKSESPASNHSGATGSQPVYLATLDTEKGDKIVHQEDIDVSGRLYQIGTRCLGGSSRTKVLLLYIAPSFLTSSAKKTNLHPTSWLDGLRGVAAFVVYISHFILGWYPGTFHGYNSSPTANYFFQLPIFRIFYAGRGMVTIFFILSGYVLSYSALHKIRKQEFASLLNSLASSVFRRALRLFLPLLVSTFISFLIMRHSGWIAPWPSPGPQGSFWGHLHGWCRDFIQFSSPTLVMDQNSVYNFPYGFQLWTIPREFRGSLATYLTLMGLAKTTQTMRLFFMFSLCGYFWWMAQWDLWLFQTGMLFAEIQFLREDLRQSSWTVPEIIVEHIPIEIRKHWNTIRHVVTILVVIVSIHFLTFPDESAATSPGYGWMISRTPAQFGGVNLNQRYWLVIGAIMFVGACCWSPSIGSDPTPMLQRPFITPFAQYLANISYALYVSHAWILYNQGRHMNNYVRTGTTTQYISMFLAAAVVCTFLCFWVADVFWRLIDVNAVLLAKWMFGKCSVK